MRAIFTDFENRKNDQSYQTSSKELTASGVIRILRANVDVIATSAEVIVQRGTWKGPTEWHSPSSQYCVEIIEDN